MPFLPRDHKNTEALIRASGLEYNIQRDYLYIDNIPNFFAPSWKLYGNRWLFNSHDVPGAYVAHEGYGRVHAALLLGRGEPNTVYDVTGPEAVTDRQVFEWICNEIGGEGEFVDMPDEELRDYWIQRGLPTSISEPSQIPMKLFVDDLLCCGEMIPRKYMVKTSNAVGNHTGRRPLLFQELLSSRYKGAFV